MKTTKKQGSHFNSKPLYLVSLMFCITLLMVSFASATITKDFVKDTEKSRDSTTNYGTITLKDKWFIDVFGWFEKDVKKIKLTDNTDICGTNCYAIKEIELLEDGTLIDDVRFYRIKDGEKTLSNIRSYEVLIKTDEEEYEEDVYEYVCKGTGKLNINGTEEQTCENKKTGTIKKKRDLWEPYNNEVKKKGTYIIKLSGEKRADWTYDWQVKSSGVWTTEWAVWGYSNITEAHGNTLGSTGLSVAFVVGMKVMMKTTANISGINKYSGDNSDTCYILDASQNILQTGTFSGLYCSLNYQLNNNTYYYLVGNSSSGSVTHKYGTATLPQVGTYFNWTKYLYDGTDYDNDEFVFINNATFLLQASSITLNSPADAYVSPTNDIDFNCSAQVVGGATLTNISLWGNWTGVWILNETQEFFEEETIDCYSNISGRSCTDECDGVFTQSPLAVWEDYGINSCYSYIDVNETYILEPSSCNSQSVSSTVNATYNGSNYGCALMIIDMSDYFYCPSYERMGRDVTSADCKNTTAIDFDTIFDFTSAYFTYGITGPTSAEANFDKSISPDGDYLWTCQACDSDGDCGFATTNRTLSIDTTEPSITILYPNGTINYGYYGQNISLNYSIIDSNPDTCWYEYNEINTTVSCTANSTMILNTTSSLRLYANDSVGNNNYSDVSWDYRVFENSLSYNATTYETQTEGFILNLSYNSALWLGIEADLIYDDGTSTSTKTGTGNNLLFTATKVIPAVASTIDKQFYFSIRLTNTSGTTIINTTLTNQTVTKTTAITTGSGCSAGLAEAFYFNFGNEQTRSTVNFITNLTYVFRYGYSGNTTAISINGTSLNAANFSVCINNSLPYYSIGYGEIQYETSGFSARRYYIFSNTRLTNVTVANTLYSLPTASSTSFLLTITDTGLSPYSNYYTTLLRWYPEINEYKVVEMGRTDDKGQTVKKVKVEDVDYRIGVYTTSGTLIKLIEPIRMVCLASPCTYSVIIPTSTTSSFTTLLGMQTNLSYDSTNNRFIFIWNDPSQTTSEIILNITKVTSMMDIEVCSDSSTDWTGILICTITNTTGTYKASVYRSASPSENILSLLIEIRNRITDLEDGKTIGLLITIILIPFMGLMAVWSPVAVIVFAVVAIIPAFMFGAYGLVALLSITIIGGVIIYLTRRIS